MTPKARETLRKLLDESENIDAQIDEWEEYRERAESQDTIGIDFDDSTEAETDGYDSDCPKVKAAVIAEIDAYIRKLQNEQRRCQPPKARNR